MAAESADACINRAVLVLYVCAPDLCLLCSVVSFLIEHIRVGDLWHCLPVMDLKLFCALLRLFSLLSTLQALQSSPMSIHRIVIPIGMAGGRW